MSDKQDNIKTADQILEEIAVVKPIPFPYVHVGDQFRLEFANALEKAWLEGNYKIAGSLSYVKGESVTKQIRALIEHDAEKCMDDRYERENPPECRDWQPEQPTRKFTPEQWRSMEKLVDQVLKKDRATATRKTPGLIQ